MGTVRKAGDPGVVERIASFLGDNGYTRAWGDAVVAGLRPIDRMVADTNVQAAYFAKPLREAYEKDQGLGETVREHVGVLSPDGVMQGVLDERGAEVIRQVVEERGVPPAVAFEQLALQKLVPKYTTDEGRRRYHELYGPPGLIAPQSGMAQMVLSHPSVAYGLPAVGAGLAAWGIHDLLAQQQQAEKDSQLPLQGGVKR